MGLLSGTNILVTGIANKRSIAFGIADAASKHGANLIVTFQNDRLLERSEKLLAELNIVHTQICDLSDDAEVAKLMQNIAEKEIKLSGIVHAVAYAPADQLSGNFVDNINKEGFNTAHEISSYTFTSLAKYARVAKVLAEQASLVTMSYFGSEKAVPNYNTMGLAKASLEANVRYMAHALGPDGIRVNAVSPGPIKTLASSGIKGCNDMLAKTRAINPTRKNVTIEEVGNVTAFILSDLASGITGEVIHVDHGYHCIGMAEATE